MSIDINEILNCVRCKTILDFPDVDMYLSNDEIIADWILEIGNIIGSFPKAKDQLLFIDSLLSRLHNVDLLQKLDNVCTDKSICLFSRTRMNLVRGIITRRRSNIKKHWFR